MKKYLVLIAITAWVFVVTGCAAIYGKFKTTPEEAHNYAVEKVKDYAENYVCRKIDEADGFTAEYKVKLKGDVKKVLADIEVKLNDLRAKYVEAKNAKKAAKEAKKAEKEASKGTVNTAAVTADTKAEVKEVAK